MQVVYRKITDVKKLENNPRYIKDDDFQKLCVSIKNNPDYFEARPLILSDRTGDLVVIAGNQRIEAAKEIGLKEVPTFLLEGLTEEREKEIIIRDNISNGEWDWDMLANEWDSDLLNDWGMDIDFPEEETEEEENTPIDNAVIMLNVEFKHADAMTELYNELINRGFKCSTKGGK